MYSSAVLSRCQWRRQLTARPIMPPTATGAAKVVLRPAVGAVHAIDTAAESHSRTRELVHGCLRALAPRVCRRHVRRCHDWFGLAVRAAADGRSAQPCMVCGWRWRSCWLFQSLLALLVKSRTLVP